MLRKGATRAVLLIGPYAIKVPRTYSWRTFLNGLLANMQERMFWYQMKSPLCAKVHYADPIGLVLVMERADRVLGEGLYGAKQLTPEEASRAHEFFDRCKAASLPVDPTCSNIGVFGDTLKLIDYGS